MAKVEELFPFIQKWEGGFVDDPLDNGGATNMGVTIATFESYCRKKGYPRPTVDRLRGISKDTAMDILKTMYWDRWRADDIESQRIANVLVDWVWASGAWGIKIPQRLLGVKEDGIVGPKTLSKLNAQDPTLFFNRLIEERVNFVESIVNNHPSQKRFLKGWLNRIHNL